MVTMLCFRCRGQSSIPGQGTKDPACPVLGQKKKKKKTQNFAGESKETVKGQEASLNGFLLANSRAI